MLRREADGWAPLYRRIFSSDVWCGQTATTKVVLVWIIGSIRHSPTEATPAGSIDVTLDEIGKACNTTRNTTRAALQSLVDCKFIQAERSQYGVRITVVEWRRWLACNNESKEPLLNRGRSFENASSSARSDAQPLTVRGSTVAPSTITEEDQDGSDASHQSLLQQVQPLTGFKETAEAFHQRFVAAYNAKPTWRAAEGAQLKRLIVAHGAVEVQRRIAMLFDSPPRWIRPPFTFMTLVKHFDALVAAAPSGPQGRRGGLTPTEIIAHAASRRGGAA